MVSESQMRQTMKLLQTGLVGMIFFSGVAMAIEEPKYAVLEQSGPFEIRAYEPKIIAEVKVKGDMSEASSAGFRLIAAYIFGKNQSKEKIEMTAPVTVLPQAESPTMGSPVLINEGTNEWLVSFVMPSAFELNTLPTPVDEQVHLKKIPAENKAVITFSGFNTYSKVETKTSELKEWMASKHLTPIGPAQFARYNPPWTLPFLRRSEIMFDYRSESK